MLNSKHVRISWCKNYKDTNVSLEFNSGTIGFGILMEQIKDTLRPPLTPVAVAVDLSAHALVTPIPQTLLAITVNREWSDYT